ncbi:unnamed protein product [Brachionus calyciflorus]|uniref:C-type lectin domain-containing protein n=1 Tax=Brachionus calyciflorus TaxID=104777 RepID=A0A814DIA5_9BILA|nr:unnamed protein product [Brachionus calyciflorus]
MDSEDFVHTYIMDENSYILQSPKDKNGQFTEYVYKIEKSPATKNLILWEKGIVEIPRWIVYASILVFIFILTLFIASLVVLGNLKPDSIYGESCATTPCSKALNLKCINKTCTCDTNKYYNGKCSDLSKYNESCIFTSNCDSTQMLTCVYSTCLCDSTRYWSSTNSKCVDRVTYNQDCNGDQCKLNINIACNLNSGLCDCSDPSVYYWNLNECVVKKNYGQTCSSDIECLDSEMTVCDGNKCTCSDAQYFDSTNSKCVSRLGEGEVCSFDEMCLSPMFCSAFLKCSCSMTQFFDSSSSQCIDKYFNGVSCSNDHQCRSDLRLSCISGICSCTSPKYVWYSNGPECKLIYSYTSCSSDSDCNPEQNLICNTNSNFNCSCPNQSVESMCDCKRESGDENYWDGSNCVSALTYQSYCTQDYQCKTLTEETYCNLATNLCDCKLEGGFLTSGKCRKCSSDEKFFNDLCYFVSDTSNNLRKQNEAEDRCKNRDGHLVIINSDEVKNFLSGLVVDGRDYWISGEKKDSSYSWKPTNDNLMVDPDVCPDYITGNDNCLYYNADDQCFYNDKNCESDLLYYICQK